MLALEKKKKKNEAVDTYQDMSLRIRKEVNVIGQDG